MNLKIKYIIGSLLVVFLITIAYNFNEQKQSFHVFDNTEIDYVSDDQYFVTNNRIEVYDGLIYEELVLKLDSFLKGHLAGMGYMYADLSLKYGVDPYLAVAISMHETGCNWNCSSLTVMCNNVGGQKGGPGCNGGSYKAFNTLEEGINSFVYNIYHNYVRYGLTTASLMNPKYAADPEWASKVNNYIYQMKNY